MGAEVKASKPEVDHKLRNPIHLRE